MTLTEFFNDIYSKALNSRNPEWRTGLPVDPWTIIAEHAKLLAAISKKEPNARAVNASSIKSSWSYIVDLDKQHGLKLFEKYKGQKELRKKLTAFLDPGFAEKAAGDSVGTKSKT